MEEWLQGCNSKDKMTASATAVGTMLVKATTSDKMLLRV
jgi:hypothetical protein